MEASKEQIEKNFKEAEQRIVKPVKGAAIPMHYWPGLVRNFFHNARIYMKDSNMEMMEQFAFYQACEYQSQRQEECNERAQHNK